jgi:outer membrane protein OmpA-like peptidoglycan-associated protein
MMNFNSSEIEPEIEESGEDYEASTYLSIGDLMSGLLMFFALLFIVALLQLQQAKEELQKQRRFVVGTLIQKLSGNNINVQVNQDTGDVSVRESILFDEGSAEIKPNGKAFLRKFIPLYSQVVFSPSVEQQISRVVIEGHTSSKGSYERNLELSLLRSLSVAKYIFSNEMQFATKQRLSQKILSSGRGEIEANQVKDNPGDRKVIFRFQFRGEEFSESYKQNRSLQNPSKKSLP